MKTSRNDNEPFKADREGAWPVYRAHLVAASGEFVGTMMFLFLALGGTQVASTSEALQDAQSLLYIALSFGMSLIVNAWAFYRISGGLFNPAVVVAMCVTGTLPVVRGLFLLPAEILGGLAGGALIQSLLPGLLGCETQLAAGTSIVRGLFLEMFLTSILVFVILMLAAEKSNATPVAPVGIGLTLFIIELVGVKYTGGSVNPVRSFTTAVVNHNYPGYHWIYWVGPIMGGLLAGAYYKFVKYFNYEEANPGQDDVSDN